MQKTCGEQTEVYSRIVGYFRPVKNWNNGKREEYNYRKTFNPETAPTIKLGTDCTACKQ